MKQKMLGMGLGMLFSLGMIGQSYAQTAVAQTAPATQPAIDTQALIKDLQTMRQGSNGMRLVFWMPKEYWDVTMATSIPSPEQRAQVLKRMDGYEIVAVLEGKIGTMGVLLGTSREDLAKKLSLQVGATTLKPLASTELSNEMQQFVQSMQPMMTQMMGQIGQNMHMLVFKGTDASGTRLLDPKQAGGFKVLLGDETFAYRLPLGSLLPPVFDAESGDSYPGNYLFSPFTGKKLVAVKP